MGMVFISFTSHLRYETSITNHNYIIITNYVYMVSGVSIIEMCWYTGGD